MPKGDITLFSNRKFCALISGRLWESAEALKQTPSKSRIVVVEDYVPLRRVICSELESHNFEIAGEASDGLSAILKVENLKPDLVLIDVSLPLLNGLEATRRLLKVVPQTKILFFSDESSPDIVKEAFSAGATGYIHKLHTHTDLMPAIETVLRGGQFVGAGLEGEFGSHADEPASTHHNFLIYSDSAGLLNGLLRFVSRALKAGSPAIVIATKLQLDVVFQGLDAEGLDSAAAARERILIPIDVEEALSTVIVDDVLDPARARAGVGDLLEAVAKTANGARIAAAGTSGSVLWARGKRGQAASLEAIWADLGTVYKLDMLCAYPATSFGDNKDDPAFNRIKSFHSAVYSR